MIALDTRLVILLLLSLSPLVEPRYALIASTITGLTIAERLLVALASTFILSLVLPYLIPLIDSTVVELLRHTPLRGLVEAYYRYRIRVARWAKRHEGISLIGLIGFIALPLPFTGMWSGALAGYLLGLSRSRIIVALLCGGLSSIAVILVAVTLASLLLG